MSVENALVVVLVEFEQDDAPVERHSIKHEGEAGPGFVGIGLADARPDGALAGFGAL